MRYNKLFVIGNGFDLNHGLKTSYRDFIINYLTKCKERSLEKGSFQDDCLIFQIDRSRLNYAEIVNEAFHDAIERNTIKEFIVPLKMVHHRKFNSMPILIRPQSNFIKVLLSECLLSDWSGIEDLIYRELCASHFRLENRRHEITINRRISESYQSELDNIRCLNKAVKCLKENLLEYLLEHNNPSRLNVDLFDDRIDWGSKFFEAINTGANINRKILFLNFNYTDYYERLVEQVKIKRGDAGTNFISLNIHGSLNDLPDNVVFGVGDEQNDIYMHLESLYDDEWLFTMKSFQYFRSDYYQNLLGFVESGEFEVYVLGHSCSITDRTLLNMVFEHEHCNEINLFHYNGVESYNKTAFNVARNFKDKVKLRKVLKPFNAKYDMKS